MDYELIDFWTEQPITTVTLRETPAHGDLLDDCGITYKVDRIKYRIGNPTIQILVAVV